MELYFRLHRTSVTAAQKDFFRYRIAGFEIYSEFKIACLAPYALAPSTIKLSSPFPQTRPRINLSDSELTTTSWLADQGRIIRAVYKNDQCELQTQEFGSYLISKTEIYCFDPESINAEILFGPCFAIASILNNQFHLHASSVIKDGRAIVFLGRSGTGKSTLAYYLATHHPEIYSRLSDDTVPIELKSAKFVVKPHYPQLKLPARNQCIDPEIETCEIKSIFVLNDAKQNQENINIRTATVVEAMMGCIKFSVASKLLSPTLLKRHLDYVSSLVKKVPIRFLDYPHNPKALSQTAKILLSIS